VDPGYFVKIYIEDVCLEFQMEIERRSGVGYLHGKSMKLPEIVVEPESVYHHEALDENRVKYCLHDLNLRRSDLRDWLCSGRYPLKMMMPEFCKSSKLSHGLGFER
jgi:hypothetical protein